MNDKNNVFQGKEFIRLQNHVEAMKMLQEDLVSKEMSYFHSGYICAFHAFIKALEKDLNE
jgi:hypothetical protein